MNLSCTPLNIASSYYPIGNTPPVCLTQDLPPELKADILLLGCGDARSVLFTCFADSARKIDVTCCDIEPMILARNVLLYTLLIDDETNCNIDCIWNIYYHWKIDKNSLELLASHTKKLLAVSESLDQWNSSVYGSTVRFCDEMTLSSVKTCWMGFMSRDESKLQVTIDRAKAFRKDHEEALSDSGGYRSAFPVAQNDEAWADLCKVAGEWWEHGMVPSSHSSAETLHLNPAILYSPNELIFYYCTSPLGGTVLSTAYALVNKKSPFRQKTKGAMTTERLVNCAKGHFTQWALSYRKAILNGLVIRIFSGDALSLCFALHNCKRTGSTSVNLSCHFWTSTPLILHHKDYGTNDNNAAPTNFDVIDTSNIIDYIGPLSVISVGSCLLKDRVTSCLYTESLVLNDISPVGRFSDLLGIDVLSMSLLLGLVPPEVFTNATNTVEEHRNIGIMNSKDMNSAQARSRFRWKRLVETHESCGSPRIQIEANELAKLLIQVHYIMFKVDDLLLESSNKSHKQTTWMLEQRKLFTRPYSRTSFAFLLSVFKTRIITDWDKCMEYMHDGMTITIKSCEQGILRYAEDLALNLHIFGVDDSLFLKPDPADLKTSLLASVLLSKFKDLPDMLCVTVRVPKEQLSFLLPESSSIFVVCSFKGAKSLRDKCFQSFSSVQVAFGKWHEQTEDKDSRPFIEEDNAGLSGTSDMFASVIVPTSMLISMLLRSQEFIPEVKCGCKYSVLSFLHYGKELGLGLCFSSNQLTSKDVFITRFMPGMSGLPKLSHAIDSEVKVTSDIAVAHVYGNDFKINTLSKRIDLESDADKATLAAKSAVVKVEFKSPLTATVSIAESLKFQLQFPVPVSMLNFKLKIARTSSYVEVESTFLDPIIEDAATFLVPCFLMKIPSGVVPVSWTLPYIDLDAMPSIDLDSLKGLWVHGHVSNMFSVRETNIATSKLGFTFRVLLKQSISYLFMFYAGFQGKKMKYFGLLRDDYVHTLIVPSSLRLDLTNNTLVLDCAWIPLTSSMEKVPAVNLFLQKLKKSNGIHPIKVGEAENRAWKAMVPAFVECCRTWEHTAECEYLKTGEVPLTKGVNDDRRSSICSCGLGKFPKGYLKDQKQIFPTLGCILNRFGTRVAISPIFSVPHVENCCTHVPYSCNKCGSEKKKHAKGADESLMACSGCKKVSYCSVDCQKEDWKGHRPFCKRV